MAPVKRRSGAVEQSERPEKRPKASTSRAPLLNKEDAPFPRGGASVLTPLEHKQIKIQAKQDVLFEQSTGQKAHRIDLEDEDDVELPDEDSNRQVASTSKKSKVNRKKNISTASEMQENPLRIESLSYKVRFCPFHVWTC